MFKLEQKYKIIVAAGSKNEIGDGDNLLWHLPADMAFFKAETQGADVIMGRKTYDSIPEKFRPLPNRTNIVITRNRNYSADDEVYVCNTIEDAIGIAENCTETQKFIIGGGSIYEAMFDIVDEIFMTRVHHEFPNANTFFPEIDDMIWREIWRQDHRKDDKNLYDYSFIKYERR